MLATREDDRFWRTMKHPAIFRAGVLSYAVPASAYGGGVAYSVWRRVGS